MTVPTPTDFIGTTARQRFEATIAEQATLIKALQERTEHQDRMLDLLITRAAG